MERHIWTFNLKQTSKTEKPEATTNFYSEITPEKLYKYEVLVLKTANRENPTSAMIDLSGSMTHSQGLSLADKKFAWDISISLIIFVVCFFH